MGLFLSWSCLIHLPLYKNLLFLNPKSASAYRQMFNNFTLTGLITIMPFSFAGKKILVTGAGRDISRALTKAIANNGGEVYALGRNRENIESLVRECDIVHPVIADLSDWEATKEKLEKLPALDCVVYNAAANTFPFTSSLEITKETLAATIDVSLLAPINVIQVTAKKMIEAGIHGSIVNVTGYYWLI